MVCNLDGQSEAEFSFFAGLCPYEAGLDNQYFYNNLIENNAKTYLNTVLDLVINYFEYKKAIEEWNITYIVLRDTQEVNRFLNDSMFELAFKNSEVAIFRVVKI